MFSKKRFKEETNKLRRLVIVRANIVFCARGFAKLVCFRTHTVQGVEVGIKCATERNEVKKKKVAEKTKEREKQQTHTPASRATSYYTNGWDCGAWEIGQPARFAFRFHRRLAVGRKIKKKTRSPALYTIVYVC